MTRAGRFALVVSLLMLLPVIGSSAWILGPAGIVLVIGMVAAVVILALKPRK